MADQRIKAINIYISDKMTADCTSNDLNLDGGVTIVQTAGGPTLQEGPQQSGFNVEGVVKRGSGNVADLMRRWIDRKSVRVSMGIIGNVVASGVCMFENFAVKSSHADGSGTFSASLKIINGAPDLT